MGLDESGRSRGRSRAGERPSGADSTRHRVLDAARLLFAAQGYRATSMRQIAQRVGMTKAALYYHFPAKDDILSQLTEPLLEELEAALAEAETHLDPDMVRWRAIEGTLDVYLRHRKTLLMLVRDMTLLVQAPVADRFRAAAALANELVAGPDRSPEQRVRAAQVVAALGDPVIVHGDLPPERLRRYVLAGVRALLGVPDPAGPTGPTVVGRDRARTAEAPLPPRPGRARGRAGGRPPALSAAQVAQAREMYRSGSHTVDRIAQLLGVSRATVYRCIKTV